MNSARSWRGLVGALALLLLCGCFSNAPLLPAPLPPPPVTPVDPPPTLPPGSGDIDVPAGPDFPRESLDLLVPGMTVEEVTEVIGSEPIVLPDGPLPTVRWYVTVDGEPYLLWVVFDDEGLLKSRGLSAIRTIPSTSGE